MSDSRKQQILDACGGMKSAAEIMGFLTAVATKLARNYPDDGPTSPRLRIVASYPLLSAKTGYGTKQVYRAIQLLAKRGFITVFKSEGQTTEYQVNIKAIDRWVQPMELFERQEVQGTVDLKSRVEWTRSPGYPGPEVQGFPISTYIPFNYITGDDDEKPLPENKTSPGPRRQVRPEPEPEDGERQELLQAFREVGITKEQAEARLSSHTRQKIKAAFAHLRVRLARGDMISRPFGRFILSFLNDPTRWEHEYDQKTGCWVNVTSLVKRAGTVKARDRPFDPKLAAVIAWESLGASEQADIRTRVDSAHPQAIPAVKLSYYHREAFNRKQNHEQEEKQAYPSTESRGDGSATLHAARGY